VLSQARKKVMKETGGHYPAPLVALETVSRTIDAPLDRAFELEAQALGRLIVTDVSKNLIHVFHLMEGAKKAAPRGVEAGDTDRVAGLGAGVMGGGIAQLAAAKGRHVRLKDIRQDAIGLGLRHARELFDKAVKRRRMDAREAAQALPLVVQNGGPGAHRGAVVHTANRRQALRQALLLLRRAHLAPHEVTLREVHEESQPGLQRGESLGGLHKHRQEIGRTHHARAEDEGDHGGGGKGRDREHADFEQRPVDAQFPQYETSRGGETGGQSEHDAVGLPALALAVGDDRLVGQLDGRGAGRGVLGGGPAPRDDEEQECQYV